MKTMWKCDLYKILLVTVTKWSSFRFCMQTLNSWLKMLLCVISLVVSWFCFLAIFKVNESRYKQCWDSPTLLNLLKKYWEKIINNWLRKVNIDTISWEELFDRSADHKWCNIPWLVNFRYWCNNPLPQVVGYMLKS